MRPDFPRRTARCNTQVFLTHDVGDQVLEQQRQGDGSESSLLWPLLVEISNLLLEGPEAGQPTFASPASLKAALKDGPDGLRVFPITIDAVLPRSAGIVQGTDQALFTIVGDASVTAHYRLGVGVNHGVERLEALPDLVRAVRGRAGSLAAYQWKASKAIANLVQRQVHAVFFEAYCNHVIYEGTVYRRGSHNSTSHDYIELPNPLKALDDCMPGLAG